MSWALLGVTERVWYLSWGHGPAFLSRPSSSRPLPDYEHGTAEDSRSRE